MQKPSKKCQAVVAIASTEKDTQSARSAVSLKFSLTREEQVCSEALGVTGRRGVVIYYSG